MQDPILKRFKGWIENKYKENPEVRNFLTKHERLNLCIDNLKKEIRLAEWKMGGGFDAKRLAKMIDFTAEFFSDNAIRNRDFLNTTDAEKMRMSAEANRMKELEAEIIDLEKEARKEKTQSKIYLGG